MSSAAGLPKRRLGVQLVASHVAVALLALASAGLLVYLLAPRLFETMASPSGEHPGQGGGGGGGRGTGIGQLRPEIIAALEQAMLWGALVGLVAAIILGALLSRAILKPVDALRRAAGRMADGDYHTELPQPKTRELAELVNDVGTMSERLVGIEERRTRLLGEVGHEMRTPLTVIDAQVEAMIDGVRPTTPENLAMIATETRRLRRLAADLSALSRAEEGRTALDLQPVQLAEVVRGVVERLRPQTDDAGIELRCEANPGVGVLADADRMAQVITNLMGNAIRATPTGGVITVSCRRDGAEAVVEVADSGEGLAPDELGRIFERFYRVPGRRSAGQEGGSGIGLTIAKHLIEQHGGSIAAASPGKGQGATFTVRLPLASAAPRA